jgi:hypothetical protein
MQTCANQYARYGETVIAFPRPPEDTHTHPHTLCRQLLFSLLRKSPVERISFEEFFSHPFLAGETPHPPPSLPSTSHLSQTSQRSAPAPNPSPLFPELPRYHHPQHAQHGQAQAQQHARSPAPSTPGSGSVGGGRVVSRGAPPTPIPQQLGFVRQAPRLSHAMQQEQAAGGSQAGHAGAHDPQAAVAPGHLSNHLRRTAADDSSDPASSRQAAQASHSSQAAAAAASGAGAGRAGMPPPPGAAAASGVRALRLPTSYSRETMLSGGTGVLQRVQGFLPFQRITSKQQQQQQRQPGQQGTSTSPDPAGRGGQGGSVVSQTPDAVPSTPEEYGDDDYVMVNTHLSAAARETVQPPAALGSRPGTAAYPLLGSQQQGQQHEQQQEQELQTAGSSSSGSAYSAGVGVGMGMGAVVGRGGGGGGGGITASLLLW